MIWTASLVAFAAGVALAALASRVIITRSIARARAAERRARAAEHLAEVGAMTGGLAHEIKNPLSTLGLNAQLLSEAVAELPLPEHDRSRLTRRTDALRRETQRLGGILQDFLEFAGELRIDPRPADLAGVVDELVDFFTPQAESRGVRLRADVPVRPLPLLVDVPHLKQAVLNLMLNALQAMEGVAPGTPRELILRATGSEAGVELHVMDTGPGMDEATLARIFRPYFTTKSGGTGLGLPTTRRIVEAQGGRVEVHSEPGKGTDFAIVLPSMPDQSAFASGKPPRNEPRTK